jgi:hypothetical protein
MTLTNKRCWEIGKQAKEQFGESWESWTSDPKWDSVVKERGLTETQLFYCKLGVDGNPFQDTSLSDESGDILDDELMPFGKHKGSKFGSLTPNYLRWVNEQPWLEKWPTVALYVKRKLDTLNEQKIDKETVRQMLSLDDD